MTILELKKTMMKAKKEDKEKANIFMMLIDTAQKIAKEQQREVIDSDIIKAAKKLTKVAEDELKYGIEKAKKDIEILKEFIPKPFDKIQMKHILIEFLNDYPDLNNKKARGRIIGEMRKKFGEKADPKIINEILNEILK